MKNNEAIAGTSEQLVSESDYLQLSRLVIEHIWRNDNGHADTSWGTMKPTINLNDIKQPTLIINGSNDALLLTINSYKLFQGIPGSILSLYPDSAHAALFQYPEMFVEQCNYFLNKGL